MNAKRIWGSILMMCMLVALGAGCAKKSADVMPASATKVEISDKDTDWQNQPAPAPRALTEDELRAQQREAAQRELGNMIFFAFDSFELTPESREVLNAKAEAMKKYSLFNIVVEGHCDERGTSEYNLALGERRAKASQEFLNQLGIPDSRITIVSYGKERPMDPGHNEAAWSKNRRDEFKLQN
ncbi:peptidoglycan-associated lipoprotein [Humidesulfovibrio mexicanus]|uniref:Peptidoglycan-associated lipoprotein n=1 Tax=Humidesulfovibrio mexicanus TaxID=147047 RepID=A0A239D468_9BACT|nr:peptidoglycan-associated lipoprotein Pal [Humidesulfovibrio mexicanus]SNS27077.1 peptidoglycan-associated lipoprotein [Humidesulfovibrio mexicanus]